MTKLKNMKEQLRVLNQQLLANEQQLRAANQQLRANEQALIAAKEKAEESERYLDKIMNNIGDPVFVKDDESRLVLVNDAFCAIFNLKRDKIIGKTLAEDVKPEERENFLKIDKQVLNTGQESIIEESLTVRGGETRTISTRKTRFIDNSGKKFLVGIIRDITERKKSEEQLKALNQQLQANEQQLRAANQQLKANEQELQASNQQLKASEQQLLAANQQLRANEQELIAANENVEKSEFKFRTLVDFTSDWEYWEDKNKDIIYMSPSCKNNTGYSQTEFISDPSLMDKIVHPEDLDSVLEHNANVHHNLKNMTLEDMEFRIIKKDGKEVYFSHICRPIIDEQNNYLGRRISNRDITEQKLAEQKIRESEEKYRALYQNAPLAYQSLNINGEIVDVNPQWLRILDYKRDEVIGKWFGDFLHSDYKEHFRTNFKRFKEKGTVSGVEFKMLKSNGTDIIVSFEGCIGYDEKGNFKQTYCTFKDITQQISTKEKIQESERKLKYIIENSTNVFYSHTPHHEITFISPQIREVLQYEPEEVMQHWTDFITDNPINEKAIKYTEEAIITGKRQPTYEMEMIRKDGEKILVEVRETPVIENNKVMSIVGSLVDITERKKYEKDLKAAKENAEESDRLKSAFLANMSHEIRTPMNGILGFTDLLKEVDLTGSEHTKYIGIIEKSGERMLSTINDIIDISRIESGEVMPNIKATNINSRLDALNEFFKPEAEKKNIQLIYKPGFDNNSAVIHTDPEKLDAIFTNLIKNALKFTQKGSIEFGYERKGKIIHAYVKDTGEGIDSFKLEKVFERFIQEDDSHTRVQQGSGLGLSIVKAYVELMDGKIWVESVKGEGSCFHFTIPYMPAEKVSSTPKPDVKETKDKTSYLANKTILVVEDDESSLEYLKVVISSFGILNIVWAKNGENAVKLCKENPSIDLVLMDINMPVMNGFEATKAIKAFRPELSIIAQTAYALTGDREKSLEAGCDDYITKPIKKEELSAKIEKYIK